MRSRLKWALAWLVAVWLTGEVGAQPASIDPGLSGDALIKVLRKKFSPSTSLSYSGARKELFTNIDKENGQTRLIYTPEFIVTSSIPLASVANTEHVWAQSKFANSSRKNILKCDLHHLFPCRDDVNSERGNKPFGDIPDKESKGWYISSHRQTNMPPVATRDLFSESVSNRFEPREDDQGDIARAMFYVFVIYGDTNLDKAWFQPQLETLLQWHHKDPADLFEFRRTKRVAKIQKNENPFILDHTLIYRVLNRTPPAVSGPVVAGLTPPSAAPTPAAPITGTINIVTWNIREIFSPTEVQSRSFDLKSFAQAMKPDIVLLQEVTSHAEVRLIRDAMGLTGFHTACSNFEEDNDEHGSFEVAVISRFPLSDVVEFDPTPDNDPEDDDNPETEHKLVVPTLPGLRTNISTARGFLRVRVDEAKLILRVTHLKSSRGQQGASDRRNAEKRELVAAAIALDVSHDDESFPGYSSLVAGDFNTGATDADKNGTDLQNDDGPGSSGGDGYDDTQALLTHGIVESLKMKSLVTTLGLPSFRTGNAADGPIDWILVAGQPSAFSNAARAPFPLRLRPLGHFHDV